MHIDFYMQLPLTGIAVPILAGLLVVGTSYVSLA